MLRPVSINSFLPSLDRFIVVRAAVKTDELAIDANHGSPHPAVPVHAFRRLVHGVDGSGRISQIADRIVRRVLIDVVNQWSRLLAVVNLPRDPVGLVGTALPTDVGAPVLPDGSSPATNFCAAGRSDSPNKFPSIRVIVEAIAECLWDNFHSHIKPSFDVVRGSVVGATDTPILSH